MAGLTGMPVSSANQLCCSPREAQNDLQEFRVFGLPDLKTVLEEFLNIPVARSGGENKRFAEQTFRIRARTKILRASRVWS